MNIYFSIGSNLGNRLQNLRAASQRLEELGEISAKSSVFETAAWGGVKQPDYLNACLKVKTSKTVEPLEILKTVKNFETEIGRVPSVHWGSRKIDIDIIMIDDLIFHSQILSIPHARMSERLFVLVPLKEILPSDFRHPENNLTAEKMIKALDNEPYPLRITDL